MLTSSLQRVRPLPVHLWSTTDWTVQKDPSWKGGYGFNKKYFDVTEVHPGVGMETCWIGLSLLFMYKLTDLRDGYLNHILTEVAEHLEDPWNLLRWREASPDLMMSVAAVRSAGGREHMTPKSAVRKRTRTEIETGPFHNRWRTWMLFFACLLNELKQKHDGNNEKSGQKWSKLDSQLSNNAAVLLKLKQIQLQSWTSIFWNLTLCSKLSSYFEGTPWMCTVLFWSS